MIDTLNLTKELNTALKLGDYTIAAKQQVTIDTSSDTFVTERTFVVAGPRFVLDPAEVLASFPPPNMNGDYNNFLPYLTIRRATLPWERRVSSKRDTPLYKAPFLALLILTEQERKTTVQVKTQTLAEFCSKRGLTQETSDDPAITIRVLEAPGTEFKNRLPTADDLPLLAHVRNRDGQRQEAILLGNRRPLPDTRYEVHLVSLEELSLNGLDFDQLTTASILLPSLYRWEFTCGRDKMSLVERLKELECDGLRLPKRANASATFDLLRQDGYAAMPYRLAWGDSSHGLYRGPLLPVSTSESLDDTILRAAGLDSSEGLIDYFSNVNLPDVSLAAAWELGRMLMLRRRGVAMQYYRFRREQAGLTYQKANAAEELPLALHDVSLEPSDTLPNDVRAFCNDLMQLQNIPFPYLVPDPRMLPEKSLRVFQLDKRWIACLLAGALSLGRARSVDRDREKAYLKALLSGIGEHSGCLIRSPVVAEFPNQTYVLQDADKGNLSAKGLLRRDVLAPDVLLLIVKGVLQSISAQDEPQTAHYGFKEGGGSGLEYFEKDLRDPTTFVEIKKSVRIENTFYRNNDIPGVLNVYALANEFVKQSTPLITEESHYLKAESHHFALQLIESGSGGITITLGGKSS